jgi:SPP1 family predicted phage head-tail adaptor
MILNGKPINPGELRTAVTLEIVTLSGDAGGAQAQSYADLAAVWCRWTNVHGGEVWQSQALHAQKPATVLIRYRSDLTTANTVRKDGERYKILSIDDIQNRNEFMELKVQLDVGSA